MVEHTLWTEKYRPTTLKDYVWIDNSQRLQVESWVKDGFIPHLLLSGGPGLGKTTLAKCLFNELNVDSGDIYYINASHETGIDFLRNNVTRFAETMPMGPYRYILLDEADYLSQPAQALLRNTIEEYSMSCRWVLTCNRRHKIIPALFSRVQEFHIETLDREQFMTRVVTILIEEGIDLNQESLEILEEYVAVTYPDMRKCINSLQQNCHEGQLHRPSRGGAGTSTMDFMVEAVGLFKQGKVHEGRKVICAKAQVEEYEQIYRMLYTNLDWWGKTELHQHQAIVIIANRLRDHAIVADPEINIAACLIELSLIS